MTTKRPDYSEARNYYIKGDKNEYPTLLPQNIKFLNAKIDLIDHCLIELRKNEKKFNAPKDKFYKELFYINE